MDPEVAAYLKRILNTIGIILFWMGINITFGIMFGYAYFEEGIHTSNIAFYIWLLISIPLMILYFRKLWKEQTQFGEYDNNE